MPGPTYTIHIHGLREFARELKAADKGLGKELRQAHLRIAKLVEGRTHAAMRAGGRQAAKAVPGVKAKATQRVAAIRTIARPPFVLGVIWGMKRRSGWYGRSRYEESGARQFRPWVGNQWTPGAANGKPYFLGPAMNDSVDEAIDLFAEAVDDLAKKAGFD